jgi:hypothetical protein
MHCCAETLAFNSVADMVVKYSYIYVVILFVGNIDMVRWAAKLT